jgi:tetratricopeptide (TPR) repeat protein
VLQIFRVGLLAFVAFLAQGLVAAGPLEQARQLYARTQYREAIQLLTPLSDSKDGRIQELIGKAWFMLADFKKAESAFEKAIAVNPDSSEYHHWLGKAYGRRAESSNPLSAPLLANKARKSFEMAVELDPKNIEAVNDLFSYYVEAPGFLGGGLDKAAKLAETRIQPVDPVEYHYALAQLSERRKEFKTAELHFRRAFQLAPNSVGRAIDLANFLSKQGRLRESEAILAQAEKIAPKNPRLLFERANAYIKANQKLDEAKALLEQYLKSSLSPDDPPRREAERLLKQAMSAGA